LGKTLNLEAMKESKFFKEFRSLTVLVVIAFLLKATLVEAYIVPTGSMENTIMTGDFLIGNRFVYGMRTPDWFGIPYTDIGVDLPYIVFPKFREAKQGDIIIFKYPRDTHQKYVKRCIALPGDTLEIRSRRVYINGNEYPQPEHGKFLGRMDEQGWNNPMIFLSNNGNKDHFKPLRVPKKGDEITVNPANAQLLLHLMVLDGHELTIKSKSKEYVFTMTDPENLLRRKKNESVFDDYYPLGNKINPWMRNLPNGELYIDSIPIKEISSYTVEQDYFWAMGDNRDDSYDSRFWGFVPRKYLLGEALFVYMSLNFKTKLPRFGRFGVLN